jgi:periplasmic divalent cation tolerance protein
MSEVLPEAVVVFITAPTRAEAVMLAEMLVEKRLAACVQVLPEMLSVYHWDDAVQRDPEYLLLVKTKRERFAELEQAVRAVHSYTTPEIIALPIVAGSAPYLEWLAASLGSQSS